jgi:hypothetical protein
MRRRRTGERLSACYYGEVMVLRWTFAALALLGTVLVIVELAR